MSSKILINFSNSTIVEKVDTDDFMIPMHKFEFVDLGDLFKLAESYGDQKTREFSTGDIYLILYYLHCILYYFILYIVLLYYWCILYAYVIVSIIMLLNIIKYIAYLG